MAKRELVDPFSLQKLMAMSEPITLQLDREVGDRLEPIPIPALDAQALPDPSGTPGHNWSRDAVAKLDWWLRDHWSGGGNYIAQVFDGSGNSLKYGFMIPMKDCPARPVPAFNEAVSKIPSPTAAKAQPQQPHMQTQTQMPPFMPGGPVSQPQQPPQLPQPAQAPIAGQPQQQAPQQYNQPQQQGMQGQFPQQQGMQGQFPQQQGMQGQFPQQPAQQGYSVQTSGWPQQQVPQQQGQWPTQFQIEQPRQAIMPAAVVPSVVPVADTAVGEKLRALEAELQAARLREVEAAYQRKADAERAANDRTVSELRDEIRRQGEGGTVKGDDRVRALEEKLASQKESALESKLAGLADVVRQIAEGKVGGSREDDRVRALEEKLASQKESALESKLAGLADVVKQLAEGKIGGSREDDRVRALEEKLAAQKQSAIESQLADMANMVKQLAEGKIGGNREDERFRRLEEDAKRREDEHKREMERLAAQAREEKLAAQTREDKRDAQTREENLRREMKENAERIERMMIEVKSANKGPDPMFEMMKESSRQQLDFQKQMATMQQSNMERMSAFMVSPMQLAETLKNSSASGDGIMRNMLESVGGVVNLYRGAAEHITGMVGSSQGGGGASSWVPGMIEGTVARSAETINNYLAAKRDAEVSANKARIAEAQERAQSEAIHAQVAMNQAAQQRPQAQFMPPPAVVQPTVQAGGGLAGAGGNGANGRTAPRVVGPTAVAGPPAVTAPAPAGAPAAAQQAAPQAPVQAAQQVVQEPPAEVVQIPRLSPQQELEIFGLAYPSVKHLRAGVQAYLDANGWRDLPSEEEQVKSPNEKGEMVPVGLSPSAAVDAVLQGVEIAKKQNIQIPAFQLYVEERWGDLVQVLVPGASEVYKIEMTRIFAEDLDDDDAPEAAGDPNAAPAGPPVPTDPALQV
jgi:uncharacterized coiled-coil protein SlyX